MGKSLTGKELGQGISQRKDGRYQARFTNRFGKRQTIYGKTINEIRQKLRAEQYEDEKQINVVSSDMTLDEWFEIWMETCKNNCRDTTRQTYRVSYNRIKASLGWRKLSGLNLIVMQQAINELKSDASRKDTKKLLVDMLNKAVDSDLIHKNVAKQINTVVSKDSKPEEPRVLTIEETEGYEDLVFTTTKNTPISPRDTTVVMKFITERIRKKRPDFEPITPHTLRHTFATRCIERGMNPKTLQIILGHSTIQLTMNLYCHVTDDMLISEMSKFENYERHEPRTSCADAHSVTGVAL